MKKLSWVANRVNRGAWMLVCTLAIQVVQGVHAQDVELPIQVRSAAVDVAATTSSFRTAGNLSVKTQDLSFEIAGRLIELKVEEGEKVVAGQLLARLEEVDAVDRERDSRVVFDQALSHYQRIEALFKEGKASEDQHDATLTALQQARINHNQAQVNLSRCSLFAPADGVIGVKYFEHPGTVGAGTPIYALQRSDRPWLVEIDNLTDRQILSVRLNDRVEVSFAPYPQESFPGHVSMVGQEADQADGLYRLEVNIATERPLKPGMLAKVTLFGSASGGSTVPLEALRNLRGDDGELFVPSADRMHARRLQVTVLDVVDGRAVLAENLSQGEVITFGRNLSDGSRIEIVE